MCWHPKQRGLQRTNRAGTDDVSPRARASRAVREVRCAALRCGSAAPRPRACMHACMAQMASRRIFSSPSCFGLLSVLLELVLVRLVMELMLTIVATFTG